jgi:hypothetical protein
MSVHAMALVWDRDDLDQSEKLVLLSLADHCGEEMTCYPSVSRLCKRTGMSERGVQSVMKRLIERRLVAISYNEGKRGANLYALNIGATPAAGAPPQEMHPAPDAPTPRRKCTPTPAAGAPEPSLNRKEPSARAREDDKIIAILSQGMSQAAAEEFLEHRKAKRAKLTPRAASLIVGKLQGHPNPTACVMESICNGWTGVFPEKGRGQPVTAPPKGKPSITDEQRAARERLMRGAA